MDPCITIVIPVYKQGREILAVLEALAKLNNRELVRELLIIGHPDDPTFSSIEQHRRDSPYRIRSLHLESSRLVAKYNHGLAMAETRFVMPIHADSLVETADCYANFLAAFDGQPDVAAATAILTNPKWAYDRYGFWQKCAYARGVGYVGESHMGNFSMFDRDLLAARVGFFDTAFEHCGGEDNDLRIRIIRAGLRIVRTETRIVHAHPVAGRDTFGGVTHRERICAEAYGVYLRKHGWAGYESVKGFLLTFFRPALVLALLVPGLRWVSAAVIGVYAFMYTGLVFREEYRDRRVWGLPFFNIYLLFLNTAYTVKGILGYRPSGPDRPDSSAAKPSR